MAYLRLRTRNHAEVILRGELSCVRMFARRRSRQDLAEVIEFASIRARGARSLLTRIRHHGANYALRLELIEESTRRLEEGIDFE